MNFLRTRRLNVDAVLKILLLAGFAFLFYQILSQGRALLYVNPKMIPFIQFGALAMLFMLAAAVPDIFTIPRKKLCLTPYTLFFIPLLLSSVFPAVALDSGSLAGRSMDMGSTAGIHKAEEESTAPPVAPEEPYNDETREQQLPYDGEKAVVEDSNYVTWLTALYAQPEEHRGLELEISGFVYRNEELEPQTFMLARLIMVCCAADMQLSGLLCLYDKEKELESDTWLRVNGTLTVETFYERPIPALLVEHVTKIERPELPYVFP